MTKHTKEQYIKEAVPLMMKQFGYTNEMAVPRIEKVIINTGFGKAINGKSADEQKKIIAEIGDGISLIAGQRAAVKSAKKSIAGFKLRKGSPVGVAVTLREQRMYDFLDRLIHVVLPRSRDFRGIDKKAFDKSGNITIGITEHTFFPEILPEKVRTNFGLQITIQIAGKNKEQGLALLEVLGFPFK